jgi:hypothetical protein
MGGCIADLPVGEGVIHGNMNCLSHDSRLSY